MYVVIAYDRVGHYHVWYYNTLEMARQYRAELKIRHPKYTFMQIAKEI